MATRNAVRSDLNAQMQELFDTLAPDGQATLLENFLITISKTEVDKPAVVRERAGHMKSFAERMIQWVDQLNKLADSAEKDSTVKINLKTDLIIPEWVTGPNDRGGILVHTQRKERKIYVPEVEANTTPAKRGRPTKEAQEAKKQALLAAA